MIEVIFIIFKILLIVVPLLLSVAYLTYAERKVIGAMQLRKGPSIAGPFGLGQPIADAIKLLFKEPIKPKPADKFLFWLAPIITFMLSIIGWAVIPFGKFQALSNINVGLLYILAISSLSVYGVIIAGWASNSKYAFLGAIRAAAQIISYEISVGFVIICVILATGSLNLTEIIERQQNMPFWLQIFMLPLGVIFFIASLAETNRLPFDLPEAESELVAGYNVEYSSMPFALFFLGEYANMIMVCAMTSILFLGGYLPPFGITVLKIIPGGIWLIFKILCLLFCFIWIRATLPRYRFDQLIKLSWKVFLPITFSFVIAISSLLVFTNNVQI